MKRARLLALTLIVGLSWPAIGVRPAVAEPAEAPETGIGIRLVDIPTAAAEDPRARAYIVDYVRPDTVIERRIEVSNRTPDRAAIAVYPAAATVTGGDFVGADGRTQNDLSRWTRTTPESMTLDPQKTMLVEVRVKVPPGAPRGERYGVVWAEARTEPATPDGVVQISRVGIRLYLAVDGKRAPRTDFTIESLTAGRTADNLPEIQATVLNTGERALDLTGQLTLSKGPAGLTAGPFPVKLGTTLGIGESQPVRVPLDKQLPNGPWLAKVTIRSGLTERTATATVTFPSDPGLAAPVAADEGWSTGRTLGVAFLGGLILLIGLGAAVYLIHRKRAASA